MFALRAVAVVRVLGVTRQLTESVGVLRERDAVGFHPSALELSLTLRLATRAAIFTLHGFHMSGYLTI